MNQHEDRLEPPPASDRRIVAVEEVGLELQRLAQRLSGAEWTGNVSQTEMISQIHYKGQVLDCRAEPRGVDPMIIVRVYKEHDEPGEYLTSTGPETYILNKTEYTAFLKEETAPQVIFEPGHMTAQQVANEAFQGLLNSTRG